MENGYLPASFQNSTTADILAAIKAGKNVQLVGPVGSGKSFYLRSLSHHYPSIKYVDLNLIPEKTSSSIINFLSPYFQFDSPAPLTIAFDSFNVLASPVLADLHNWLNSQFNLHRHQLTFIFTAELPLTDPNTLSDYHHLDQLISEKIIYLSPLSNGDAMWFIDDCLSHMGKKLTRNQKENLIHLSGGFMQTLKRLVEADDDFLYDIHLNYHLEKLYRNLKPVLDNKVLLGKMGLTNNQGEFTNLIFADFLRRQTTPAPLPFADQLTSSELKVYRYLSDHPNDLCSREDLISAVWGTSLHPEASDHALDQLIHRLKTKLLKNSSTVKLTTVRGRGHRLISV